MNTLSVRRGASLPLQVVSNDKEVLTVTLIVKEDPTDLSTVFTKQVNFDEGVADLTLTPDETLLPIGKYVYQLTVTAPNNTVEKYPETSDCEGDCDFPIFEVLGALDAVRD
jgi:hypothetical protein